MWQKTSIYQWIPDADVIVFLCWFIHAIAQKIKIAKLLTDLFAFHEKVEEA